jgi:hypothetical protein
LLFYVMKKCVVMFHTHAIDIKTANSKRVFVGVLRPCGFACSMGVRMCVLMLGLLLVAQDVVDTTLLCSRRLMAALFAAF